MSGFTYFCLFAKYFNNKRNLSRSVYSIHCLHFWWWIVRFVTMDWPTNWSIKCPLAEKTLNVPQVCSLTLTVMSLFRNEVFYHLLICVNFMNVSENLHSNLCMCIVCHRWLVVTLKTLFGWDLFYMYMRDKVITRDLVLSECAMLAGLIITWRCQKRLPQVMLILYKLTCCTCACKMYYLLLCPVGFPSIEKPEEAFIFMLCGWTTLWQTLGAL